MILKSNYYCQITFYLSKVIQSRENYWNERDFMEMYSMVENVSIVSESKKKKSDDNLKKMWTSWTTFGRYVVIDYFS